MIERKCKRCGDIDYGIWGTIGLVGWSLVFMASGYVLAGISYFPQLSVIACVFGLILLLPMFFIQYHEERDEEERPEPTQLTDVDK